MKGLKKLPNRVMFVSPTVQAGWEEESTKIDFQKLANLGEGSYGVVWKAKHKKTERVYAIKEIKKRSLKTQSLLNHVKTEVKVMYALKHPNITKLYNHFEDQFSIYFVLEYAENGEMFNALLKTPKKKFQEAKAAHYIRQLALALRYIHRKGIVHRDIKPENLLIGKDDELKLADFGWSNFMEGKSKRQTYCGTLDYLAPEMVAKEHLHDHRVDIWSIGVLIYELCTGSSPFSSPLFSQNKLSEDAVKENIAKLNYTLPKELSAECCDLISKILILHPQKRISIDDILSHPWIKQVSQEDSEIDIENWEDTLVNQFGVILQNNDEERKKYQIFSKDEIFTYSRIQSILNANFKKVQQESDKKNKLKIEQLEQKAKRQEDELRFLRSVQVEHQNCGLEQSKLKLQMRKMAKTMEQMSQKIRQYEAIIAKSGR